jgi:hypothetical protein
MGRQVLKMTGIGFEYAGYLRRGLLTASLIWVGGTGYAASAAIAKARGAR